MHPAFWPYLIGLVPILLARTWPARVVAICFGCISIGLGCYMVWSINKVVDVSESVQHVGRAVAIALVIASISLILTYCVDRNYGQKANQIR